jgi:hypothetical protein
MRFCADFLTVLADAAREDQAFQSAECVCHDSDLLRDAKGKEIDRFPGGRLTACHAPRANSAPDPRSLVIKLGTSVKS